MYQKKLLNTVRNVFWKDTSKALLLINEKQVFHGTEALLTIPIWYNSKMIPGISST